MRFFIVLMLFCAASSVSSYSYADSLTSALKQRMHYLSQNQAVLSKNIANANTPGYKAMEVKKPKLKSSRGLKTTSPMHIRGVNNAGNFKVIRQKDTYETAPNGNNVSIEQQMIKLSDNSMQYQVSTNMLKKLHDLVKLATGHNR